VLIALVEDGDMLPETTKKRVWWRLELGMGSNARPKSWAKPYPTIPASRAWG
jgi:hypothetical protein